MSSALPKLSYVLLSHNREKYIRAAIESAFAQDYEGELEYIFSDDCSTDRTFEIIKECVAAYKGNRRVVVTQTPRNLHLAGNTNHAVQFVESDWVIRADDDDISHVSRCTLIGKAIAAYPEASCVYAKFKIFHDLEEEDILNIAASPYTVVGSIQEYKQGTEEESIKLFNQPDCLHQAWSKSCYSQYGPLPLDGYYVDDVITNFRALSLGNCVHIDQELAYIRRDSGNMSWAGSIGEKGYKAIIEHEKFIDKYHNITLLPLRHSFESIASHLNAVGNSTKKQILVIMMNNLIAHHEQMKGYWRKGIFYRLSVNAQNRKLGLFNMLRCLPLPLFAVLLAFYRKLTGKI